MSAATLENVAKLYVATFNRAPDSAGLDYWANCGMSLEDIAQSFFDQPETQTTYPSGTQTTAFVTSVYQNLFNRAPDQAGLDYWAHELDTDTVSNQNFILAVTNGALGSDATILTNKATVGLSFANAGLEDVELARSVMTHVDDTEDSITSAEDIITQNTPPAALTQDFTFEFSNSWLVGQTLYEVSSDASNEGGSFNDILDTIVALTFGSNGTVQESQNSITRSGTYSVDNAGVLMIDMHDQWGPFYMKAVFEHTQDGYILVDPAEDYDTLWNAEDQVGTQDAWGYEYLFSNQADAQAELGELAPSFNAQNATLTTTPNDLWLYLA